MTERTTIRLPEDLVRRAKRKAAAEGRTLTALIQDGVRHVLDERGRVRKRKLPPVSRAAGGLKSGVDLDDSAALAELDDLAIAARLR